MHPEYAIYAPVVAAQLAPAARSLFICYYTAAMLLQQLHAERIQPLLGAAASPLPDLFSTELGLPTVGPPNQRLTSLAARQALLSGDHINWLGTYQHGAERLLAYLEKAALWPG